MTGKMTMMKKKVMRKKMMMSMTVMLAGPGKTTMARGADMIKRPNALSRACTITRTLALRGSS